MTERIGREKINIKPGYLYFIGKDGYIWEENQETGKKKRIGTEHIIREEGYLYFVDKDGYAARAKMSSASD